MIHCSEKARLPKAWYRRSSKAERTGTDKQDQPNSYEKRSSGSGSHQVTSTGHNTESGRKPYENH